jgi:alpha-amylase
VEYPQPITVFDFPLYFKFKRAAREREEFHLRELFEGTLQAEQPKLAVTFVENHDYEYGREYQSHVEAWFKPLAYAIILLRRGGYPCLFFPDYYGSLDVGDHKGYLSGRTYLELLLKLRKQFALGEELTYVQSSVAGWTRLGFVAGAKGAMAVVMNTAHGRVQAIRMHVGRGQREFYHLATCKRAGRSGLCMV